MAQSLLHRLILNKIEENGRIEGAPKVVFLEKKISIEGENIYAGQGCLYWFTMISGFYLNLPPNAYGVVVFPDGTSHDMSGGLHEVPPGLYKLIYVDKSERFDFLSPVSEYTTDGERLTLKVILRYRVNDPLIALGISRPIETLIEHVETDVAQYIRTHDHSDIADSSDKQGYSKLFSFFYDRHIRREPLSQAISIIGIELKEFAGDKDYVEMRRKARMEERKNEIEKEQVGYLQDLGILKGKFKAENEKAIAEHTAEMERKATEQRSEIEKIEARHEKEKQEILHQVRLQNIELEDKRRHWQRQYHKFAKALEAVSLTFSSGHPINPNVMKTITDLVMALKEEVDKEPIPISDSKPTDNKSSGSESRSSPPTTPNSTDKVENLTNTLLNLLNPKK
jgi:hypothetical protein